MLPVSGFSKMNRFEKIRYIDTTFLKDHEKTNSLLDSFRHQDQKIIEIFEHFSENTLSSFHTPYGVVPNMLIDGKLFCVPMVTEESSVVAACSNSAKFWLSRGGFTTVVMSEEKIGHVHFEWEGDYSRLQNFFDKTKEQFLLCVKQFSSSMVARGGGIISIELVSKENEMKNLYQIKGVFNTCDAMGANFINTILEEWAKLLEYLLQNEKGFSCQEKQVNIIMAILSNYTPNCVVKTSLRCPLSKLSDDSKTISGNDFANKMIKAVKIAQIDTYRATTHNKGIFNGIDSVVMATGNDFRAVEACGHAYACKDGKYKSLSHAYIDDEDFVMELELPLSVGTVGGLTRLHPLAKMSLELLGNPSANELMRIISSIGLAQNFAAIRSLVTTGIQKGHMKMHLINIITQLEATEDEKLLIIEEFDQKIISFNGVSDFLTSIRKIQ